MKSRGVGTRHAVVRGRELQSRRGRCGRPAPTRAPTCTLSPRCAPARRRHRARAAADEGSAQVHRGHERGVGADRVDGRQAGLRLHQERSEGRLAGTIEACLTADRRRQGRRRRGREREEVRQAVHRDEQEGPDLAEAAAVRRDRSGDGAGRGTGDEALPRSRRSSAPISTRRSFARRPTPTRPSASRASASERRSARPPSSRPSTPARPRGSRTSSAPFDGRGRSRRLPRRGSQGQDRQAVRSARSRDRTARSTASARRSTRSARPRASASPPRFPGCAIDDLEQTHACLDAAIECRVCLALNRADDLARDCDVFDDGAANESCVPPLRHRPAPVRAHVQTSGFMFETAMFFDLFTLNGAVDIDCGAVDPTTGTDLVRLYPRAASIRFRSCPGLGVACVRARRRLPGRARSAATAATSTTARSRRCTTSARAPATPTAPRSARRRARRGGDGVRQRLRGLLPRRRQRRRRLHRRRRLSGRHLQRPATARRTATSASASASTAPVDPSLPGGLHCNLGVAVDVETAAPCGDGDVLFQVGDRCVPFTTETTQAVIVDANNVPGEQIPPGQDIYGGLPLACTQLAAGGPSGLVLASSGQRLRRRARRRHRLHLPARLRVT